MIFSSSSPGQLCSWVHFRLDQHIWRARPSPALRPAEWGAVLWDMGRFDDWRVAKLHLLDIQRVFTIPQHLTPESWWEAAGWRLVTAWRGPELAPPPGVQGVLREALKQEPTRRAAALWWGQLGYGSILPSEGRRAAARAGRKLCPLSLLSECPQLVMPQRALPHWVCRLGHLALLWYGAEWAGQWWNSIANLEVRSPDFEYRWLLATSQLEAAVFPPATARLGEIRALHRILREARPEHARNWSILLEPGLRKDWGGRLAGLMAADYPPATLTRMLRHPEDDPHLVPAQRVDAYLDVLEQLGRFTSLIPDGWWLRQRFLSPRCLGSALLVLAGLTHGAEQPGKPDPQLLELARLWGEPGQVILAAARRWEETHDAPSQIHEAAQLLELSPDHLNRLLHWRSLAGLPPEWPKPVQTWLRRKQKRAQELGFLRQQTRLDPPAQARLRALEAFREHETQELRLLLRTQQSLETSLRDAAALAWKRLLEEALLSLLSRWAGLPLEDPELLQAGWLLSQGGLREEHLVDFLRQYPREELTANREWLGRAPANLNQSRWLRGLRAELRSEGRRYDVESASPREALRMGDYFSTCLSLRGGPYSAAALTNSMDINKQVLYLRGASGTPLLRQLVGVNQEGQLVQYPIYANDVPARARRLFRDVVAEYARQCDLPLAPREGQVEVLHGSDDHYSDGAKEGPEAPLDPWVGESEFQRYAGGSPAPSWPRRSITRLALGGHTAWIQPSTRGQADGRFIESLDYKADLAPLIHLTGSPSPYGRLRWLPVALAGLPLKQFLEVLQWLAANRGNTFWPGRWLARQALVLLYLVYRRDPDVKALWRALRRSTSLRPFLWWFVSYVEIPQLGCLLRSPRQSRDQTFAWWLAAGRQGCMSGELRESFKRSPDHIVLAGALARSPHLEDRILASRHYTRPIQPAVTRLGLALWWDVQPRWEGQDSPKRRALLHESRSLSLASMQLLNSGLSGDFSALRQWVKLVPPPEQVWRLELLTRLRPDQSERLLRWWKPLLPHCRSASAYFDLCLEQGMTPPALGLRQADLMLVRLHRPHQREQALLYLRGLPSKDRLTVICQASWWLGPELWEELADWLPTPEELRRIDGSSLERLLACHQRQGTRLGAWLKERRLDSVASYRSAAHPEQTSGGPAGEAVAQASQAAGAQAAQKGQRVDGTWKVHAFVAPLP